ncbi:MAG TPA: thiamine pyrophosphate-dependent dehydrogenase E1 component subunit alpha [Kiritimatiellia bacterium]|nr:thiamine pyrophosphate-dependent dehydrogenase E1 component subunit alpha [Kiritimatiellia bacterium]
MSDVGTYEQLFQRALRIRMVEEKIIELYPSDKIQSPVHLSIGQEAVAVGVCESLRSTDLLFGSYRSHAFYLAKGGDLKQFFAELYGKVTGCCRGKGGSMHMAAPEVGFMGTSAVVASTISHAVGAALAAKQLGKDQLSVAVFGDGATDEGVYHESLNFASLKKVPVVFVCENNGLAVHSRTQERQAYNIIEHARTYGLPTVAIAEGHDFAKIGQVFSEVVKCVRRERTPQFVEIATYRYREHVGPGEDFQAGYRSRAELESWTSRDPLILRRDLLEKFRPGIAKEIDDAVAFAESSPWPGREELLSHVI